MVNVEENWGNMLHVRWGPEGKKLLGIIKFVLSCNGKFDYCVSYRNGY